MGDYTDKQFKTVDIQHYGEGDDVTSLTRFYGCIAATLLSSGYYLCSFTTNSLIYVVLHDIIFGLLVYQKILWSNAIVLILAVIAIVSLVTKPFSLDTAEKMVRTLYLYCSFCCYTSYNVYIYYLIIVFYRMMFYSSLILGQ